MKGWLFLSSWAQRCPRFPQLAPAPCATAQQPHSALQLCTPTGRLSLGLCPVGCSGTAQLFVLRLSPFPGSLQCAGRVHTPSQFSHLSLLSAATWAPESCHSGQCWDGFRINSCSQSCRQLSAFGLAADKPFIDAGQSWPACSALGSHISLTAKPAQAAQTCPGHSAAVQALGSPVSSSEQPARTVLCSGVTGAAALQGPSSHPQLSRIWAFPS